MLVLAATRDELTLIAIRHGLDYLGTPYTLWIATKQPGALTPEKLAAGCHGYYQGVILTNGGLGYSPDGGTAWRSALTAQEWQTLWAYEAEFGIRQVNWYTYPTADFGFIGEPQGVDTSTAPFEARLTTEGKALFSYVNAATPVAIRYGWTYLAKPAATDVTPLLTDPQGNAVALIKRHADGREVLSITFAGNAFLQHNQVSQVFAYGLINWVARGLFLGERHIYLSAQVDDLYLPNDIWQTTTPCGTPTDMTGVEYRVTGKDWDVLRKWQKAKQGQPTTRSLRLDMAFNAVGTAEDAPPRDSLTPSTVQTSGEFKWISHTYTHLNLDAVTYQEALDELLLNDQAAQRLRFPKTSYSKDILITPQVSGLRNPEAMRAAWDAAIRYVVSDTSRPEEDNPTPNAGIPNWEEPRILMIPRRPNNLYYNLTKPDEWAAEYNCIYRGYWGRKLSYNDILEKESTVLVNYMLRGEMDPWMFHQSNIRAYDGKHSLLSDLLDQTLTRYNATFNLPVQSPTMDDLGRKMAARMQYNAANVTATIVKGQSITLRAEKDATVPVTGLNSTGAEQYGGQPISWVKLTAGQPVTLPLA